MTVYHNFVCYTYWHTLMFGHWRCYSQLFLIDIAAYQSEFYIFRQIIIAYIKFNIINILTHVYSWNIHYNSYWYSQCFHNNNSITFRSYSFWWLLNIYYKLSICEFVNAISIVIWWNLDLMNLFLFDTDVWRIRKVLKHYCQNTGCTRTIFSAHTETSILCVFACVWKSICYGL